MAQRQPHISLVARRQQRVRRSLATTAMDMFLTRGYEATTVEEIVDIVEISPSTFYRYFAGKSDLVVEFSRLRMNEFTELLAARPAEESLVDALAAAIETATTTLGHDMGQLRQFEELVLHHVELRGRLLAEIHREVPTVASRIAPRLGIPSESALAAVIATSIGSTIRLVFERWAQVEGEETPFPAIRSALALLTPLFEPKDGVKDPGCVKPRGG
jgi:AcrR family transcriptional regulator